MPHEEDVGLAGTGLQRNQGAAKPVALIKPRLRGVSHQYAAYVSVPAGLLLTLTAPSQKAAVGSLVYTVSLVVLFSVSALYHRPTWQPHQRKWMRRLDHAAIFLLIAGTYTPICLLALPGAPGENLLLTVWTGAAIGIGQSLFWVTAPKTLVTGLYILLGWAGVQSVGQLRDTGVMLVACGGLAYTLGGERSIIFVFVCAGSILPLLTMLLLCCACCTFVNMFCYVPAAISYALKWPNPAPKTFGYHEIFHALVIVASIFHFTAVARLVLSASV